MVNLYSRSWQTVCCTRSFSSTARFPPPLLLDVADSDLRLQDVVLVIGGESPFIELNNCKGVGLLLSHESMDGPIELVRLFSSLARCMHDPWSGSKWGSCVDLSGHFAREAGTQDVMKQDPYLLPPFLSPSLPLSLPSPIPP
eukprot:766693-Hanusia_phi.AAC.3